MASTSASLSANRPSMDRDLAPGGSRSGAIDRGNVPAQVRESSRSSRRRPSGGPTAAVQYSLPSPSHTSFDLRPPSRSFASSPSPISPPAGQTSFPTPIRGAHFLPPSVSPSPPSIFGRPTMHTPQQPVYSYAAPSVSSQGSLNLEVSPSPASRQHAPRREAATSPTPSRRLQTNGHSQGHSAVPKQPPPPMLTSLPLPPTPAPTSGSSRERLPSLDSLRVDTASPAKFRRPPPAPLELNTRPSMEVAPERRDKPKPLLKAGPVPTLVAPGGRRDVLSVHSQVAVLEGERSPAGTSPARRLFEQNPRQTVEPPAVSPQRPPYNRGHTAPSLSPSSSTTEQSQQVESSTPPRQSGSLVDRFKTSVPSSEGRQKLLRSQTDSPSKWGRHSEDMLRASTSSPLGKKEMKALEKQQSTAAAAASTHSPQKMPLGLTPRKSSGGLKALFKKAAGQGKGKEKEKDKEFSWVEVPPMPIGLGRPSQNQRPPTFSVSRPSYPYEDRAASTSHPPRLPPDEPGARSISQPLSLGVSPARPPSRHLPPLPPPTPSYASSDTASPHTPPGNLSSQLATPSTSTTSVDDEASPGTSSDTSSSTTTGKPNYKASQSLHLLELPELDLSLGFAFDEVRGSPSRTRLSPVSRASPKSPSRSNTYGTLSSPKKRVGGPRRRSSSFDGISATPGGQELWRTFTQGLSSSSTSPSGSQRMMYSSSSTSLFAPAMSESISSKSLGETATSSSLLHQASESTSSQASAPSSLDHTDTPSNSYSLVGETPSPSPPHTPKDERTALNPDTPGGVKIGPDLMIAPTPPPVFSPAANVKTAVLAKSLDYGAAQSVLPDAAADKGPTASSSLAPAADIKSKSGKPASKLSQKSLATPRRPKALQSRSRRVISASMVPQRELAVEMEQLLFSFRYPASATQTVDRAGIVRNKLLQLLLEAEKRGFDTFDQTGNASLRAVCFDWADALLFELRVEQPAIERGACLEGLAAILETPCLSAQAIDSIPQDSAAFRGLMVRVVAFVMTKLGAKGVFHNSLLFSGRVLAFAFFRIPHVAQQLLVTLPTQRQALMRFSKAVLNESNVPSTACPLTYPAHLRSLCFDDSKSYTARLQAHRPSFTSPEEQAAFIFRPGNWLRRWQSDDSELFPAFYRAYHRQLAHYLSPAIEFFEARSQPIPATILLRAPGYAHLASVFGTKCHSYILGSINAVTTSSSAQTFDATESAGFRGNAKPVVLETANRRLSETLLNFANSRVFVDQTFGGVVEVDGSQLWASMIEYWAKYLIGKTSLYAPKGVFCLFDLLDCITDPPAETVGGSSMQVVRPLQESLLDVPHLISVVRLVLTEGEHALTLVKIIAFVFTHYETLCVRAEDRKELCINLLLDKALFERLVLFWSQSVRSYVLRLIVFRLGHLHTTAADGDNHDVEIATVRLLNARLDRLRKRHEELEPATEEDERKYAEELDLADGRDGQQLPRSRSTITMVGPSSPRATTAPNKAERLLGLGFDAGGNKTNEVVREVVSKPMGKATNWIKKSFGKQKKTKGLLGDDSGSSQSSPSMNASPRIEASPKMNETAAPDTSPLLPSLTVQRPSVEQPHAQELSAPPKQKLPEVAQSPVSSHSSEGDSSVNSFEGEPQFLQAYHKKMTPPAIATGPIDKSSAFFAFEFELPTQSPRSDSFDPAPAPPSPSPLPTPPSPRQPPSPHMSRSFSKRSSLLPPPTASVLDSILAGPTYESSPGGALVEAVEVEAGYDEKLHAYAIRMMAELEDAQREYDEWWSEGGIGRLDNAPPRLTVAWPFSEDEE